MTRHGISSCNIEYLSSIFKVYFAYIFALYLCSVCSFIPVHLLDALDIFDGGKRATEGATATAGIWSTYPFSDGAKSISNWAGFADQVNHELNQLLI